MKKTSVFVISFLLAVQPSLQAGAENPGMDEFSALFGEEKVSSSAKMLLSVSQSPSAVTSLDREKIERTGAATISDVLSSVPGVNSAFVTDYQRLIGMRGLQGYNSSKTLILVDDVPLSLDWMGTTHWNLIPVPLAAVERVEVVRSPGTLYGANALGGVVNIVTGTPKKSGVVFRAGGGEGHTQFGEVRADAADARFGISVSGRRYRSSIFHPEGQVFNSGDRHKEYENATDSLHGSLSWTRGEARTRVSVGLGRLDDTSFLMNPGVMMMVGRGRAMFAAASQEFPLGGSSSLKLNVSHSLYDMTHESHPGMAVVEVREGTTLASMEQTLRWSGGNRLLLGLEGSRKATTTSDDVPSGAPVTAGSTSQKILSKDVDGAGWAAYLQNIYPFTDQLDFFTGGRFDHPWQGGSRFAPFSSLVWRPDGVSSWRLNSNMSYRFPNVYEARSRTTFYRSATSTSYTLNGNQDLRPERVLSVELGHGRAIGERLKVDASLFRYWVDDPIAVNVTGRAVFLAGTAPYQHLHSIIGGSFVNAPQVKTAGGEASLTYILSAPFRLTGDVCFQEVRGGGVVVPRRASPRLIHHAGLEYSREASRVLVEWEHRGPSQWPVFSPGDSRNDVEAADLMNLRFGFRRGRLDVGVRWDNVLDKEHEEFATGSASGIVGLGRVAGSRFSASLGAAF